MIDITHGRNYVRNTIRALAKTGKPFILTGKYCAHEDHNYITYTHIRPFVEGARTNKICDHLNVMEDDVDKYLYKNFNVHGGRDILVCRAIEYEKNGIIRGGIKLTEELGIPPVINKRYAINHNMVTPEILKKCVDFFTFAEGRYAYLSQSDWKNGHKQKRRLTWEEEKELKEIKKAKKRQQQIEISLEEFMDMYDKANPLWIPPSGKITGSEMGSQLYSIVPQKNLRDLLDKSPSLKKKVIQEFLKRC